MLINHHYNLPLEFEPRTILDAGANAGYSAVFFANRYHGSRIIALEPHKGNYDLLKTNTAPYVEVEAVNAAL